MLISFNRLGLFTANRRPLRGFGGYEDAMPVGPQFQISWKADKEVHFEGTPGFQGEEPTNKFLLSNEEKGAV